MAASNKLVRFEGTFDADEESLIRDAASAAEAAANLPTAPDDLGAPWKVVARNIPGEGRTLMANRVGEDTPLIAASAQALADRIRAAFNAE